MDYTKLKELIKIHSVTSDTEDIETYIKEQLDSLGISYSQTGYGSILVGKTDKPSLLVSAHIDEVGFQVTKVHSNGTLSLLPIGWVFPNRLDNAGIYIQNNQHEQVRGVVFHKDLLKSENIQNFSSLFCDIGATSQEDVYKLGIYEGATGSFYKDYFETKEKIFSSSLDNKISVFLMLEILKVKPSILKDVLFTFVTDEEMYDHSANGIGYQIKAEYAMVLDYCPVHQKFDDNDSFGELGKGPLVCYRGGQYIIHHTLKKLIEEKIKSQYQKGFISNETLPILEPANFQNNNTTKAFNLCIPAYGYHGQYYCLAKKDCLLMLTFMQEFIGLFTK